MRARGEGSLYPERRAGRPLRWVVQVSLPDGRLHRRRFADKAEAVTALRAAVAAGRPLRWVVQVSLPDGRLHRRRFADKAEAVTALRAAVAPAMPAASSSLSVYLAAWIIAVRATLAPATWARYEQICRLWLVPGLGRIRVDRLTVADVRQYLYGLPLHPQTVSASPGRSPQGTGRRGDGGTADAQRGEPRQAAHGAADGADGGSVVTSCAHSSRERQVLATMLSGWWLQQRDYAAQKSSPWHGTTLTLTATCSACGTPFIVTAEAGSSGRPRRERPAASRSLPMPRGHSDSTVPDSLRMRLQRERERLVASSSRPSEDSHSTAPTSPSTSGPTSPTRDYPW